MVKTMVPYLTEFSRYVYFPCWTHVTLKEHSLALDKDMEACIAVLVGVADWTVTVHWRWQQEVQLLPRKSWSYGVVWNSRAACWRWLFQTWKSWRFTCYHYGVNLHSRRQQATCIVQEVEGL